MLSVTHSIAGRADRQAPVPAPALPTPADPVGPPQPFCAGAFLDGLPRHPPEVARSWGALFSHCVGRIDPVESAAATAHRQLVQLLHRLPDRVPGNPRVQADIDALQLAFGRFVLARRGPGEHAAVLRTLVGFLDRARALERRLEADYRRRWLAR